MSRNIKDVKGVHGPECIMSEEVTCDNCGVQINAATSVGSLSDEPVPGDASVCWYCGHLSIFEDSSGKLRPPTDKEREELMSNPHIKEILRHVKCQIN
jgi:hypothetical protein